MSMSITDPSNRHRLTQYCFPGHASRERQYHKETNEKDNVDNDTNNEDLVEHSSNLPDRGFSVWQIYDNLNNLH